MLLSGDQKLLTPFPLFLFLFTHGPSFWFPSFLVGEGARVWAKSKGIDLTATIEEADEVMTH